MCVQSSALQSFSEHFRGTYSRHLNRCQGSRLAGEAWKQGASVQNNKYIPEPILRTSAKPLSSWSTTRSVWVLRSHRHEHGLAWQHNGRAHSCLFFISAQSISLLLADKRIYRLPVFTEEFCRAFVEELENFEQSDMPKGRPNSMNNYGVGLSSSRASLGGAFVSRLRILYHPFCSKMSII